MGEINLNSTQTPITYLVGVSLGINAITDAYLWVDSPDCFFFKNDFIHGNHDINSRLRKADGKHKMFSTISDADNVIGNRNNAFIETLKHMSTHDYVKAIFVSSMPMSQVVGTDYDGIILSVKDTTTTPIFNIPSRSMTDCWLEGYADLLFSLAKNIDIEGGNPKKENVAIVGNLFDRNEGDCIANVQELKKLVEGIGLNVVTVWLEGENFEELTHIKDAGTIISLPYGRKAAKKIAMRLNAEILELDVPFGLNKTTEFIEAIGKHFGKEDEAKKFIHTELTQNNKIDIMKWVVPHTFFGKKVIFYGDPYLASGFIDICKTLGVEIVSIYIHGDEKHLKNNQKIDTDGLKISYYMSKEKEPVDIDIIVTNAHLSDSFLRGEVSMQFGFPSYNYHVYTFEPYLGFRGTLHFINRMANTLNQKS